jgi:hypothetical protein
MPKPGLHGVIPDICLEPFLHFRGVAKMTVKCSEVYAGGIWVQDGVIPVHDGERLALLRCRVSANKRR